MNRTEVIKNECNNPYGVSLDFLSLNKKKNIVSVFLSIFAMAQCLQLSFSKYLQYIGTFSLTQLIYIFSSVVLLIIALIEFKRIRPLKLFLSLFFILFFLFSLLTKKASISVFEFALYVCIPLFVVNSKSINTRVFLKSNIVLSSLALLSFSYIFTPQKYTNFISMGISYAFLVPIVSCIIFYRFYFANETNINKVFTVLFTIPNILYFSRLLMYGSRGVVLSIAICLILVFALDKNSFTHSKRIRFKNLWALLFIIVVLLIVCLNFWNIVGYLNNVTDNKLNFLNKLIQLNNKGDASNGRTDIVNICIDYIAKKPFFGYGLCSFESVTGIDYPHNFILQVLFDGGLFLLAFMLIATVPGFIVFKNRASKDETIFFVFLVCASVVGALFSGDLWKNPMLWIFFSILFNSTTLSFYKKS